VATPDLLRNRKVAADSLAIWLVNRKAGREYFKAHVRGSYGNNKNMVQLMRRWGAALGERGSLNDNNANRTGRRRKVTDEEIKSVIDAFCKGFFVKGEWGQDVWRGFSSLRDAAESGKALVINRIIADSGISLAALWRRMTVHWPHIRNQRRRVDIKAALTPAVKAERMRGAAELRRWPTKKLDTIVWIDAKKLYITPGNMSVYCVDPDEVVEDPRLPQGKFSSGTQLHYYAGVNSFTGVTSFEWVTGTTGLASRYTTFVSSPAMLVCPPSATMVSLFDHYLNGTEFVATSHHSLML
jgi:hypothetical protein